jgi:hypothetical protein
MAFDLKVDGSIIKEAIAGVGSLGSSIREMITGDDSPERRERILSMAADLDARAQMVQAEINKIEAASSSLFVSGWRPFIGWVCGIAVACFYIPQALIAAVLWVIACYKAGGIVSYPTIFGWAELFQLLLAMLGMATLRTYERKQGVERK